MESSPIAQEPGPTGPRPGSLRAILDAIQARIIGGLVLALPIVITTWIVYWLYSTFHDLVVRPVAQGFNALLGNEVYGSLPWWWDRFVAPVVVVLLVLGFLYVLGWFVRSRLTRAVSWVLLKLPVVTTIYSTVSDVFAALDPARRGVQFKRVVLVEFPQPGMRSLGLVTNSLKDARTGRTILSVCVLTGVMPPTGFTLFVPEESVTDLDWSVNQTLQAIVSGGITAPHTIRYFPDGSPPLDPPSDPPPLGR